MSTRIPATPDPEIHTGALCAAPRRIHSGVVRVTHWINALAFLLMLLSGWRIYNASPIFAFRFPPGLTLGGWLGGALLWHFAAMWLLVVNGAVYLLHGFLSGHLRNRLWPIRPAEVWADLRAAIHGRLKHEDLSVYNAAQRLAYVVLILGLCVLVLSGLVIWKPIQLAPLTVLFGGFDAARVVHFMAMVLTLGVALVHVVMVLVVPATLPLMLSGRLPAAKRRAG